MASSLSRVALLGLWFLNFEFCLVQYIYNLPTRCPLDFYVRHIRMAPISCIDFPRLIIFSLFKLFRLYFHINISPFPFFHLNLPIYLSQLSLGFLYLSTVFASSMYLCVHIFIPKYSPKTPYNATCIYVFRDDSLVLDNQLVSSSLGRTNHPDPSFIQLSVVLFLYG